MFYLLQSPVEIILLLIGLVIFMAIAYRRLALGAALVLFLAPIYLLKIKIGWLPLNVLEILVWVLAIIWAVKKIYISCHAGLPPASPCEAWRAGDPESTTLPAYKAVDSRRSLSRWKRGGNDKERDGDEKKRWLFIFKSYFFWPILLILIGAVCSTIFSDDLKVSAGIFKGYFLAPLIFAWILYEIIKTKEQLVKIIWAVFLSGAMVAAIGLVYQLVGYLTFDGRLAAFYSSPNQLAMFLAPGFLLAAGLWFNVQKKQQKRLLAVSFLPYVLCLYFTFSYAAWLAVFGAIVFFVWRNWAINPPQPPFFKGGRKTIVFLLLFILLILFISQSSGQKIADLVNFERSSIQSRLMVWSAAQEILKDNWLLGIGPGMFQEKYLAYQNYFVVPYLEWAVPQPHNLWLAWWLQTGIIGLIGFVWLIVNFLRRLLYSPTIKQPLALALMVAIIYILLHGLVDTTFWRNDLALIFWAVIALSHKAGYLFYSQKISNPL